MPRLFPAYLRRLAQTRSAHLPILLRETRDLNSAQNELRWLTEHVSEALPPGTRDHKQLLAGLVYRRGVLGEPLQYILGKEYFGLSGIEILCRRGVLVPR